MFFFHTVIWYQIFLPYTNQLHTILLFEVINDDYPYSITILNTNNSQ